MLSKVGTLFQIASFLHNELEERLKSDEEFASEILKRMRVKKNLENILATEVEEKGSLRKKVIFRNITCDDISDFPKLTEKEFKIFFTGSYQVSQAASYLAEMIDKDGQINMQYVKDQTNVLRVQVQSRHISKKLYKCFIKYEPNSVGMSGLLEYVCDWADRIRSVGCCSHIAAIIYYLSHARYFSKILKPAEILCEMFTQNNIISVIRERQEDSR